MALTGRSGLAAALGALAVLATGSGWAILAVEGLLVLGILLDLLLAGSVRRLTFARSGPPSVRGSRRAS